MLKKEDIKALETLKLEAVKLEDIINIITKNRVNDFKKWGYLNITENKIVQITAEGLEVLENTLLTTINNIPVVKNLLDNQDFEENGNVLALLEENNHWLKKIYAKKTEKAIEQMTSNVYKEENFNFITQNLKNMVALGFISNEEDILDLSVIDMQGNCLFSDMFKNKKIIPREISKTHKIYENKLIKKGDFIGSKAQIRNLIKDKIVIIFSENEVKILEGHGIKIDRFIILNKFIEEKFNIKSIANIARHFKYNPHNEKEAYNSLLLTNALIRTLNPSGNLFRMRAQAYRLFLRLVEVKKVKGENYPVERVYSWIKERYKIHGQLSFHIFGMKLLIPFINDAQKILLKEEKTIA